MKKIILLAVLMVSTYIPMSFADQCNTRPLERLRFEVIFFNGGNPIGRMNVNPRFIEVSQREQTIFIDIPRRSIPQRFLRGNSFRFVSVQRSPIELLSNTGVELRGSISTIFPIDNAVITPAGKRIKTNNMLLPRERGRISVLSYFGAIRSSCN